MVQKISRLSGDVINKIAAGEVVENPASIAKELIENSLDAGASQIVIAIEKGGCRFLRIEDNGSGMSPEDALLSLERYATSKIRSEVDLFSLTTLGFRGEALAAISSVSQFEMKTSDGEQGTQIEIEGGAIVSTRPCARNRGTSVTVRDLFFNVPARKKFLKSSSANTAALTRIVETIALAHPTISFSLQIDGKMELERFAEEQKKRVEALLGPMPHETKQERLWGLFSSPEQAKMHRRGQYLFVNKRPVFSPLISRAVKMGYGTRIEEHAHPSFVLFLEIAPDLVDVNVHPQKKEVRFADEGKVFDLVVQAVSTAFESPAPVFSRTLSFFPPSFSLSQELVPAPIQHQVHVPLSFDFPITERPLAVVDGYFFLQADSLLLIDLRFARARVLYEALKDKKDTIQTLLWPIEVAIEDEALVEELRSLGMECRLIGKQMLAIDALPSLLDPEDVPNFLSAWREGKKLDMTVSSCVKTAKKTFSLEEAFLLWHKLGQCRETMYDPLGRRIWDRVDGEHLKKILERR